MSTSSTTTPTPTQISDSGQAIESSLRQGGNAVRISALDLIRRLKALLDDPASNYAGQTTEQRLAAWKARVGPAEAMNRFNEAKAVMGYLLTFYPNDVTPLLPACETGIVMNGTDFDFRYMTTVPFAPALVVPVFQSIMDFNAFVATNTPAPASTTSTQPAATTTTTTTQSGAATSSGTATQPAATTSTGTTGA